MEKVRGEKGQANRQKRIGALARGAHKLQSSEEIRRGLNTAARGQPERLKPRGGNKRGAGDGCRKKNFFLAQGDGRGKGCGYGGRLA